MDLGSILGGFWMDLGALGSPNGHEHQYISMESHVLPPRSPQGRLWGGFWEGLGRGLDDFWKDFDSILERF